MILFKKLNFFPLKNLSRRCFQLEASPTTSTATTKPASYSLIDVQGNHRQVSAQLGPRGQLGVINLHRLDRMNAISIEMIHFMYDRLKSWTQQGKDGQVKMVLVRSGDPSGKVFCAGGDVKTLATMKDRQDLIRSQFADKYRLDHLIAQLPIPYMALINGVCFGGGFGVSVLGQWRVATENSVLASPECPIGFFPDCGQSWALNRLPGKVGLYLGLTGHRVQGEDVVRLGLGTHYIKSNDLRGLERKLLEMDGQGRLDDSGRVQEVLERFETPISPTPSSFIPVAVIDSIFSAPSVEGIVDNLRHDQSSWSIKVLRDLGQCSPLSLKLTMELMKRNHGKNIGEALQTEFRLVVNLLGKHDNFYTGVDARLNKRCEPQWNPGTLTEVGYDLVESMFEPIERELTLEDSMETKI